MPDTTSETLYDLDAAIARLEADEPLQLALPDGGELYFARAVPFLTVYRYPEQEHAFTLHAEETAYCVLGQGAPPDGFPDLLRGILAYLSDRFSGVLLLEVRVAADSRDGVISVRAPDDHPPAVVEALVDNLGGISQSGGLPRIEVQTDDASDDSLQLLGNEEPPRRDILLLGIEVGGFFFNDDGRPFPLVVQAFRKSLHTALRRTFFDFVRLETTYNASHFHQLGNRRVSDLVWDIDRKLVEISTSFSFLMLVSATNDGEAYEQFTNNGYRGEPTFHYRFLPVDPEDLKRELFNLPIDRVKDATLAFILRDKRNETFRMLDMLANRGNSQFRYGSMQVFGGVDDDLLAIARSLLTIIPPPDPDRQTETLSAEDFLKESNRELNYIAEQYPAADPHAKVREDLSGLMVSQGVLNIGHRLRVPRHRVEALLQHEIGTHVLTYWNGRAQPLTLLHSGTPGYEDLQEGLAVLSEWFVDGLTGGRLRVLAARVVGIANMLGGNPFSDTFHLLHEEHGLPARIAFHTTARIYRAGGFTKDAVYLRGLVELLDYLSHGGELEPLFTGKLRLDYVPLLDELRERGILRPPPLMPRYFREDRAAGHPKLSRIRKGMSIFDLVPTGLHSRS